jgi:CDP-6-deoxy-D-xylo-4-hexulose-3-dehydrase
MRNYPLISDSWNKKETQAINDVIKSNRYSMGPKVREFEINFAKKFGSKYAVCVNSGSSANLLAIAALFFFEKGLKKGDEIIVPSVGWSTTYSPLFYLGLNPIFIDIDKKTLNIDVSKVENAITPRTKAIFTVNLLGKSSDSNALLKLCNKYKINLIEDNCESMGAKLEDKFTGTFGLAGTFSFFFSHHITTIEGGMVLTNSKYFYDILKSIRAHGWMRELDNNSHLYDQKVSDFKKLFWFILPGFNIRPTEFTGAIGTSQLRKFDNFIKIRRKNLCYFNKRISGSKFFYTQEYDPGHSAFSFPLILKKPNKDLFNRIIKLLKKNNIECRPIASGDITKQPFIKYFENPKGLKNKNAAYIDNYGFMVGNHPTAIEDRIDFLFEILSELDKF